MKRKFLDYTLEIENIKEDNFGESEIEELQEFNKAIMKEAGLKDVVVFENGDLGYVGTFISNTKQENNAKLTLFIGKLKEQYKKYGCKNIIKRCCMYGDLI